MGGRRGGVEDNQEGEATAFIPTLHALRPAGRRGAQSLSFYAQGRLTDEPRERLPLRLRRRGVALGAAALDKLVAGAGERSSTSSRG